jgi:uncharacterized membrane protein YkoI
MKRNIYTAIAIGIATCAWADKIQFSELPKAAQQTINRNLNGGNVQEIEREARDGRTIYEVEIRREGQNRHLRVDADGELLNPPNRDRERTGDVDINIDRDDPRAEVEVKVDDGKGPLSKTDGKVLGVIPLNKDKKAGDHPDTDRNTVTKKSDDGLDTDKQDGRILGVPKRGFETLSLRDVPEKVRQTINEIAPGARIAEIELATIDGERVYEVDIEREGKNRELHIATDGAVIKDSDATAVGRPGSSTQGADKGSVKRN